MNVIATVISDGKTSRLDLICKQGKTLTWSWTLYTDELKTIPMDLTGYSARGQIRKNYSASSFVATWECVIPNPINGCIEISMSSEDSALIPAGEDKNSPKSLYVYDIEIYTGAEIVVESIGGKYYNDPEVTKSVI